MSFHIPSTGGLLRVLLAVARTPMSGGQVIVIDAWLAAPAGGAR